MDTAKDERDMDRRFTLLGLKRSDFGNLTASEVVSIAAYLLTKPKA